MAQNIQNVVNENIDSIKSLREEIKRLKDEMVTIPQSTEEWEKKSNELYAAQKKLNDINKAANGTYVNLNKAQKDSILSLKERIKQLNIERNSMDMNSKEYKAATAELAKLNNKLRESGTAAGDWRANVGNYANSISGAFSQLGSSIGGLTAPLGAVNASMLKLATNPIGAVITALVATIGALSRGITTSEENTNKFQQAIAPLKAALVLVDRACQSLASNFLNWFNSLKANESVMNAFHTVLQTIATVFNVLETRAERTAEGIRGIGESVKNAVGNLKEWAQGLQDTFEPVINFVTKIKEEIKKGLEPVINWIVEKYNWLANTNIGKVLGIMPIGTVAEAWKEAGEEVEQFSDELDDISDKIRKTENAIAALKKALRARNEANAKDQGILADLNNQIALAREMKDYAKVLDLIAQKKEVQSRIDERNIANANDSLAIIRAQNSLSDSNTKDLDAQSAATVALTNAINAQKDAQTALINEERKTKQLLDNETKAKETENLRNAITALNAELKVLDATYQDTLNTLKDPIAPEGAEIDETSINSYYDAVNEKYNAEYEAYAEMTDAKIAKLEEFIAVQKLTDEQTAAYEAEIAKLRATKDKEYNKMKDNTTKAEKARGKALRANDMAILSSYSSLMDGMSQLFEENTIAYKASATAKAIIDTFMAANAVLAEQQGGVVARTVAMAATIAAGIANVMTIWKTDKNTNPSTLKSTSNAVAQPVLADTTPYTYTRNATTAEEEEQMNQPIWVSVRDINRVQNKVEVVEQESTW